VVRLNRAVAVAELSGPADGLALLDGLDLPRYHLLPAVRAGLLRRLGHQERARHLGGGETAQRPQRETDPRLGGQRRMAGGEDQPQPVVGDRAHELGLLVVAAQRPERQRDAGVHRQGRVTTREDQPQPVVGDRAHVLLVTSERLERLDRAELRRLLAERPFAPEPVDRAVARGRGDPRAGVVGDPALGPHAHRLGERVLDGVLGEVEVAQDPDQRGDRSSLLRSEQAVDDARGRGPYIDGRPSSS